MPAIKARIGPPCNPAALPAGRFGVLFAAVKRQRGWLAWWGVLGWLLLAAPLHAGRYILLPVGDSMTEEYGFEIPFSAPESDPFNANTDNWVDTLRRKRGTGTGDDWIDFGSYKDTAGAWFDLRDAGHKYNFGVPGFTTSDWLEVLDSDDPLGGNLLYYLTREELKDLLPDAAAVVVFLGANDLKQDYTHVYNDTAPASFYQGIVDRILAIRSWLVARRSGLKVILCTVPDVGVTPHVLENYHDPVRRAGARARIAAMNELLRTAAATLPNVAVADIDVVTLRVEDEVPLLVNGTPFVNAADPENPPDHLFCRDGFHPATLAQALIANQIVAAANGLLGSAVAPLANRELLEHVGLNPDRPFLDWVAGQGVAAAGMHDNPDGDAFDNLAEFALGGEAAEFNPPLAPLWLDSGGPRLGLEWRPNPAAQGYLDVGAESSTDLMAWQPAAAADLGGGTWRATIPATAPTGFLRLRVQLAP